KHHQDPSGLVLTAQAPTAPTLESVGASIASLGMFGVAGFHSDDVAHQALSKFVSCIFKGDVDLRQASPSCGARGSGREGKASTNYQGYVCERVFVELDDGAVRRTLATATNNSMPQPLPADALQHCPDFAAAAFQLRAAVAATGNAYAGILDKLLYGDAACSAPDQCFSGAVRNAESLEHFHFFEPAPSPSAAEHMLAMHSDIGLFLVMSPAELFDRAAAAATGDSKAAGEGKPQRAQDLVVQLADGRIVTPVLPDGALLVMNGEGLMRWMRMPSVEPLHLPYSPLHEVLSSDLSGGVRAWFGRMFMPPHAARLQVEDGSKDNAHASSRPTFAEYQQHTYTLFHDGLGQAASAAGCSPTRRQLVDEGSCGNDKVYCWMSCMSITPNITCSKDEIICANIKNGLLWPENYTTPGRAMPGHCFDCTLMCPAEQLPASASSFCNTNLGATTMWMTGFQFTTGNEDAPCVVYLFPEWVLDSAGKFAGACIGTFLLGVVVGMLGWVRNRLKDGWVAEGRWEGAYRPQWKVWFADAVLVTIIAVQVCLGYWLMLVAMTYQAELFIMVVLGLACGHLFYRPRPTTAAVGKGGGYELNEPCCAP
ncbi:hypothetical protein TSOC_004229, partial [Tetrabaena socialis]